MVLEIVMTDGATNPGSMDYLTQDEAKERTQEEAKRARDNGVYVFAIGVGGKVEDKVCHIYFFIKRNSSFFFIIIIITIIIIIIIKFFLTLTSVFK
jgi:hypothetical protein